MTSSFNCEFNRNCFDENYEKLRRWQINTLRGIMRVGVGKNFGKLEESLMHNLIFWWFPSCCFLSIECCIMMSFLGVTEVTER